MKQFIPIQNRKRAKQIYDYTGLDYGRLSPTDIDGLVEIGNKGYIIIELKRPNAKLPTGQRLALERMINDFIKVGKRAVLLLAENAVDNPDDDVIVADCKIIKEYDGTWHEPTHNTVYDVVEEMLFRERRTEKEKDRMNSVILIGRITKDLEVKYVGANQTATVRFNIAVNRPARSGEERKADFPTIVVFGKQAENAEKFVGKGSMVAVEGRLQTGSYVDKNGNTVYTTEVIARNVEFLTFKEKTETQSAPRMTETEQIDSFEAIDADVPF